VNPIMYQEEKQTVDVTPSWWKSKNMTDCGRSFFRLSAHVIASMSRDNPMTEDIVSITVGIRGVQLLVAVPVDMTEDLLFQHVRDMVKVLDASVPEQGAP